MLEGRRESALHGPDPFPAPPGQLAVNQHVAAAARTQAEEDAYIAAAMEESKRSAAAKGMSDFAGDDEMRQAFKESLKTQ